MTEIQLRVLENWRRQAATTYLTEMIAADAVAHIVAGDIWYRP